MKEIDGGAPKGLGRARALLRVFLAGPCMALFARPPRAVTLASPATAVALAGLDIALRFLADWAWQGWPEEWHEEAWLASIFPFAFACLVSATFAGGDAKRFVGALVALSAIAVPIDLLERTRWQAAGLDEAPDWLESPGAYVAPIWFALAAAAVIARSAPVSRLRRLVGFVCLSPILAALSLFVPHEDVPWAAEEVAEDARYEDLVREQAFYRQPELLESALAGLRPQRPKATDLYFVGLGGDAEQDVFVKEVGAVERLMGERFGTEGRSVVLANRYGGAMDWPVASVTSLRRALLRIGELMDRDNDMVFLFLTSHGSPDHRLALEFWPLRFDELTPEVLRESLDEAGIRWRAIVVSACYSGGFVEPLRDPYSVVISAAAPDRTSFGCSNDNDWTYFGEAFFDQALRSETDLEVAFERARAAIRAREEAEGETPSEPRIAVGERMRHKWAQYLSELARGQAHSRSKSSGTSRSVGGLGVSPP